MNNLDPECESDEWSEWLLGHRHGGDVVREEAVRADVDGYVDRVLDAARLGPGMTLADIGTGDGVVAFRAIQRVGPSLRVTLTDISSPLLRVRVSDRGLAGAPLQPLPRRYKSGLSPVRASSCNVATSG